VRGRAWLKDERPSGGGALNKPHKKWTRFACPFFMF
jgi:hypothetical protein